MVQAALAASIAMPAGRKGPHHLIIARGDRVRSFAVRPGAFLLGVLAVVTLFGGAVATAAFLYLQENSPREALAEAAVREDYEVRIADLSRQIDSLLSRQLADRANIDEQVAALTARQEALGERQRLLTGLATDAIPGRRQRAPGARALADRQPAARDRARGHRNRRPRRPDDDGRDRPRPP